MLYAIIIQVINIKHMHKRRSSPCITSLISQLHIHVHYGFHNEDLPESKVINQNNDIQIVWNSDKTGSKHPVTYK